MKQIVTQTFQQLRDSSGFRQTVITVVGNFLATGISAITIILISRLLGPTQFGVFSVGFAIVLILSKICDAGLNATLLKFASDRSEVQKNNELFSFILKIKIVLTGVVALLGLVLTPTLARIIHFEQPEIILLAFLLAGFSVWYEQLITMLQASHRFSQAVLANLYQSTAKLIGIGLLVIFGFKGSISIFAWYMLAPLIPVLVAKNLLLKTTKLNLTQNFSHHSSLVWQMAKHSGVGFVAAGLIENIDVLFVQRYLSTYETGLLGGVSRISMMLLLIAYSMGNVLYPRVAQYKDVATLKKYLKKATIVMVISLLSFFLFIPFTRWSIFLTIGPEYLAGTKILLILAASSFLTIAAIPFLALFYVFKEDWYFSVSGVGQLVILVIGNYFFVPIYGLEAAAWSRLLCKVFFFTFTVGLALLIYHRERKNSLLPKLELQP